MLKTMRLISVAAVAALALPALAGSWPPIAPRKAPKAAAVAVTASTPRSLDGFEAIAGEPGSQLVNPTYALSGGQLVRTDAAPAVAGTEAPTPAAGYEFVGGETGWQISQHKYVFAGGRLAMSDECDHAIRVVKAPDPRDVDKARLQSPGA